MSQVPVRRGVFDNSMAYARWGHPAKTVLFVLGGPGNTLPEGRLRRVEGLAGDLVRVAEGQAKASAWPEGTEWQSASLTPCATGD